MLFLSLANYATLNMQKANILFYQHFTSVGMSLENFSWQKMLQLRFFFHFNFNLNFFPRSKKILPGKWIQLSAGILRCSERLALKSGHYTVKILFVPDYTYLNMLPSQAVLHFFYLSALTPSSFM